MLSVHYRNRVFPKNSVLELNNSVDNLIRLSYYKPNDKIKEITMKLLVPPIGEQALTQLRKAAPSVEIVVAENKDDALNKVVDVDAIYGTVTPELIRAGKKLRWVQVTSAGVEGYLSPELVESDIILTNAKGVYAIHIAEHVMALILNFGRAINILIHRQKDEIWESRANLPVIEINGLTLGLLGLGGIGLEVGKSAHALGMRILAVDPTQTHQPDYVENLWRLNKLHDMLRESDFVAICCPLTSQTRKMMSTEEFKCMKPTAYLINIARGGIVDQEALIKALEAKEIAGAGLDVTVPEPLPKGNPLWQMENVIITPHMAGQSPVSSQRLMKIFTENLRRFVNSEPLLNVVDKKLEY